MAARIRKNEAYSKLMLEEGATAVVDEDGTYTMELPEWADEKRLKRGQKFFLLNANAMVRGLMIGLMAVASSPTLLKILMFTKQSSTQALAYRRYKANGLHSGEWLSFPIKEGTRAWKSLETVRKMHITVNKRSAKSGAGIISQKDTSLTLFAFMGFQVLLPEQFGIVGTREQFEDFCHFYRLIGYMLGLDDKFNCCGETLEETLSRLEAIREDIFLPSLQFTSSDFESYMKIAVEGMWHSDPSLHYDSMIFQMKRAVKVPGYYFFESEASGDEKESQKIWQELSYYTRFRVIYDVIVIEYLTNFFIFRWFFNIVRIIFNVIERRYPFLALHSFGKKYAYVEIMKSKN